MLSNVLLPYSCQENISQFMIKCFSTQNKPGETHTHTHTHICSYFVISRSQVFLTHYSLLKLLNDCLNQCSYFIPILKAIIQTQRLSFSPSSLHCTVSTVLVVSFHSCVFDMLQSHKCKRRADSQQLKRCHSSSSDYFHLSPL